MTTENYNLTKAGRQNVLATAVRFSGADVTAGAVAGTGVEIEMPPNVIILRTQITVITVETGVAATFNVGTVADDDGYGTNIAATVVGGIVDTGNALNGEFIAEATNIYVTQGTGAFVGDGDFVLVLEYVAVGRSNEVFG